MSDRVALRVTVLQCATACMHLLGNNPLTPLADASAARGSEDEGLEGVNTGPPHRPLLAADLEPPMRKTFVALVPAVSLVAAAFVAANPAHAQSNSAIYGIVDVFGQYIDGASRIARVQSGGRNGSRLGFRGTEDLGDGFKAIYTLEMGLNIDDGTFGQGGVAFGRQAFVGLRDWWGEATLGRQQSSLYYLTTDYSA